MERKIKLVPYRVYKYCPKCPGLMIQKNWGTIAYRNGSGTISTLTTDSLSLVSCASFNHQCDKCGHGENYDKSYPYIDYIEDGELG